MRRRLALLMFLAGLAVTAATVALLAATATERDRQAFLANARSAEDAILDRVETSIALLRGAAGLFAGHEDAVDVRAFRAYVARLALREQYPGLLGIGFSRRIAPAERADIERALRAQGQEGFRVWPEQPRAELHSIVYLEPLDARNRAAIGYDMYTNDTRRAAMARARDGGMVAASGIVQLVQEIDERKQPGFLIYLPVYRGGAIPRTLDERRQRLLGFAYSPIRAVDFLSSAFSHEAVPAVNFAVYHGREPRPAALLYEHAVEQVGGERFRTHTTVDVAGEPWTFLFRSRTTLAQSAAVPLAAALAGIALSFLLALLVARERRARDEAERANEMKDQFLATLSHELRTPINAVVGWAALLARGPLSDAQKREGIQAIDRNARAQARLIDDLLDMNRIVSGKLRMELQPLDPAALLDEALASVAPLAEAKSVTLERAAQGAPLIVRADPARLQQVMWNLLSNAIKFTPQGGRVQVALERAKQRMRLTVSDNGEGIEPRFLERIFDRFAQADSSTTRRHSGLGLGLAITRELVQRHGGTVRAESAGAGSGARFTVELPLAEDAAPAPRPEAARPQPRSLDGLRVLVVDDERDARELARLALERHRASVCCAGSADEALAALAREEFDVLVSDIGMPGVDGYQLMQQARALPRGAHAGRLGAIALTAFAHEEHRLQALRAGFQLHLAKPIDPAALVAAVGALGKTSAPERQKSR